MDWVDQAGDHAHFHTLHNEIVVPWTNLKIPSWLQRLIPLTICHKVTTYRGNDDEWINKSSDDLPDAGDKCISPHYIFFTGVLSCCICDDGPSDLAGIAWKGGVLKSTLSETLEMYVGPAFMIFHIPYTLGAFKVPPGPARCE